MSALSLAEVARRKAQVAEMFTGMKAKAFSKTEDISATELKSMLAKPENKVVLVDVRTPVEQDVSIIPTAIRKEVFEATKDKYKDHTIVAYCTIGYRSGVYVQKLQDCEGAGGLKALNLRGSILDWSLQGYPLVDEETGQETKRVHVYGETWNLVGDGYQAEWHKKPLAVVVVWDFLKGLLSRLWSQYLEPRWLISLFRGTSQRG
uniref:Rhodanese domain-containing protein n=1 Tax=Pyramimonas obovata TaxID=1411642 RepID=A0A7S0WSG5_9CHLO|mmetsp:Transcript_3802/g.7842  ORF Transcript_3802/g.7842 Transcript_3802/m.7842 type:complete len:205 (+) Transcript_3802:130-744(+)|eukprot:CAMPEP_0118952034 /NCGR_PEP_ID=MMETSP1169-20130426/54130_1 /TAXON_ID=36882 /ORGANISM="Pyramimonas obovata, Strain CCMP722" /LENGTH=204 /DNA_ID=CAMNT_0006899195 /DNA_START=126 /DNA_END=740 /DNA_ORIENTATION=+